MGEDSSSEEEEEEEEDEEQSGIATPAESGMATPSGISTVTGGMETPDMLELRKKKIEDAMEGGETPQLYHVIAEKQAGAIGRQMMASSHVYDMNQARRKTGEQAGFDVALSPEDLELNPEQLTAKYEQQMRAQEQVEKEDFSDLVAEHAAKKPKKRNETNDRTNK